MRTATIRVASVPASHVYVRHLSVDPTRVVRLADPVPTDGRTVPGGWWPPLMLEPNWIDLHHPEFDVFHVHFGFDALDVTRLQMVVDRLRAWDKPLVYTVHDLRNPHQSDPTTHAELLDVLVPAADRLITLTPGAAAEIVRRWNRSAVVLPHPHVIPADALGRPRSSRSGRSGVTFGIHVKSARANMDPLPVLAAARTVIGSLPGARLRLDVHTELFDPTSYHYNPVLGKALTALGDDSLVDLRVHGYFTDEQLWEYLSSIDVSVLAYRFGTHSGWLEACHDLGTAVVAPSCGYYDQQHPVFGFTFDEERFDPPSLEAALRTAYAAVTKEQVEPADARARLDEQRNLDEAHYRIYRELLS